MKKTYIIALKENNEPIFIDQVIGHDITWIGKHYKNAYIFETKKKAIETRKDRYFTRQCRIDH